MNNPISSEQWTPPKYPFIWSKFEHDPFGYRFGVGKLQVVLGYKNRLAIWWDYHRVVDLYPINREVGPLA